MNKNRRAYHSNDIYTQNQFANDNKDLDVDQFSPYNQQQQQVHQQLQHDDLYQQQYQVQSNTLNQFNRIPHTAGKQFGNGPKPKIDPNVLPSPVDELRHQINESKDKVVSTLEISTDLPSCLIPLKTIDHGYAPPSYLRMTTYALPKSNDLAVDCQLPLGFVLDPFNDHPGLQVPLIDTFKDNDNGPPRCENCKGYINPSVKFVDGGKHWLCNLCNVKNNVDDSYFSTLDPYTYRRIDNAERPELNFGVVDIELPRSYYGLQPTPTSIIDDSLPPQPLALERIRDPSPLSRLFVIDVGLQSQQSGLLHTLSLTIKDALYSSTLPLNSRKVGFITYDSTLHFHDLSAHKDLPSLIVVPDIDEPFTPLVDGLLVDVYEAKHNILAFLNTLPTMFQGNNTPGNKSSVFGSALISSLDALTNIGGEVNIFQSQLPNQGLGALTERDPAPGGTASVQERDRALYAAANTWYANTAEAFVDAGVGINIFMFPFKYIDVGTLASLSQLTGGESHFFPKFDPGKHALKLRGNLERIVTRSVGYNSTVKIRCSEGFHVDEHYGTFHQRNEHDLETGIVHSDNCIGVTLKHDASSLTKGWSSLASHAISTAKNNENVTSYAYQGIDETFYIQAAILYTSNDGKRLVRVINAATKLSTSPSQVFRFADMDAGAILLYKQSAAKIFSRPLGKIRESLIDRCVQVLLAYRKQCAQANSGSQLILPESFKLLPILTLGMIKSKCLKGGAIASDVRSHALRQVLGGTPHKLIQGIYPRVHPLHMGMENVDTFIRCSYKRLEQGGAYLIHNGELAIIWLGKGVDKNILKDIYNVENVRSIDTRMGILPELQTPLSIKIREILFNVTSPHPITSIPVLVARQDLDAAEIEVGNMLIEDDNNDAMSYVDHLCHIHKLISMQIIGESRMADAADAATWRTW